jgi:hypothetical protein
MMMQLVSERNGSALVKENPHSIALPARGFGKALARVFQDSLNLFAFHAREPLEEVLHAGAIFDVLEEGSDRHPGSAEDP